MRTFLLVALVFAADVAVTKPVDEAAPAESKKPVAILKSSIKEGALKGSTVITENNNVKEISFPPTLKAAAPFQCIVGIQFFNMPFISGILKCNIGRPCTTFWHKSPGMCRDRRIFGLKVGCMCDTRTPPKWFCRYSRRLYVWQRQSIYDTYDNLLLEISFDLHQRAEVLKCQGGNCGCTGSSCHGPSACSPMGGVPKVYDPRLDVCMARTCAGSDCLSPTNCCIPGAVYICYSIDGVCPVSCPCHSSCSACNICQQACNGAHNCLANCAATCHSCTACHKTNPGCHANKACLSMKPMVLEAQHIDEDAVVHQQLLETEVSV